MPLSTSANVANVTRRHPWTYIRAWLLAVMATTGHGYYGHGYYGHGYYGHGFGYGGYGPYGYGGYGPYGYGANRNSNQGAVRIEVDPKESRDEVEVYVDEAHAGVVDDFDGVFQRLYLPAGKHEIEIRLDGYHTIRMAIFVSPGSTYHVRGRMESVVAD